MYMFIRISHHLPLLCLLVASSSASINVRQSGWLDRIVQYHKDNFLKDVQRLPAVEIHAKIEKAPPGFEDSKDWTFESVMRLLGLLRQSETGREVHRALRRSMMAQPNRRIYMSFLDTYKYFPSIHQDNYYQDSDMESLELVFDTTPHSNLLDDSDVIIVSNPVEARLPSTKISVKMLRAILEERAFAARIMPPTTMGRIDWKPMNKSKKADGNATSSSNDTKTDDGNSTTAGGPDAESSPGDGDATGGATDGATGDASDGGATDAGADSEAPTEAPTEAPPDARRLVKKALRTRKGKPRLRNSKPVQRSRLEPRQNRPALRKKPRLRTKRPSRKAAPRRPKVLPWGR